MLCAIPDDQITCPPVLVGFSLLQGLVTTLLIRQVTKTLTVGALRYAADATRPDITYTTAIFARFLTNPADIHVNAVKYCFHYLKGTANHWLTLGGNEPQLLKGFSDADGMSTAGSKAISGYLFKIGESTISWSSKRQSLVSISTAEAELYVLAHATQEAIWLRKLATEIFQLAQNPVILYSDNQSAISIAKDPEQKNINARTKHLGIRRDFFVDYVDQKVMDIRYTPTSTMLADMLTKALSPVFVKHFRVQFRLLKA